MTEPKKSIAQALADLESEKARQAQWKRDHAKELDEAAAQRAETDSKLAALSQADRRKVLDAAGLQHVSAAPAILEPLRSSAPMPTRLTPQELPPPIKTISGFVSAPRGARPAKWDKWKHIPNCELWQAICLSFDIEPDAEVLGINHWLQHRRTSPFGLPAEFPDRLDIAQANMSTNGPIRPQSLYVGVLRSPHADVLLAEVAAAGIKWGWSIPPEFLALAEQGDRNTARQPSAANPDSVPQPAKRKTWRDVALPYVRDMYRDGQFPTAKALYQAMLRLAGTPESPFDKGTGSHAHSLFVREIAEPLEVKTLQNAWGEIKANS